MYTLVILGEGGREGVVTFIIVACLQKERAQEIGARKCKEKSPLDPSRALGFVAGIGAPTLGSAEGLERD